MLAAIMKFELIWCSAPVSAVVGDDDVAGLPPSIKREERTLPGYVKCIKLIMVKH